MKTAIDTETLITLEKIKRNLESGPQPTWTETPGAQYLDAKKTRRRGYVKGPGGSILLVPVDEAGTFHLLGLSSAGPGHVFQPVPVKPTAAALSDAPADPAEAPEATPAPEATAPTPKRPSRWT